MGEEEGEAYCYSFEGAEEEMERILEEEEKIVVVEVGEVPFVVVKMGEVEGGPFDCIPDRKEEVDGIVEVGNIVGEGEEVGAFAVDSLAEALVEETYYPLDPPSYTQVRIQEQKASSS
mmetsp:Transcript_25841/g.24673  ORF Transcript_25841/g.24673 Transcript_25841/m.24673 type:complete len:118 (-) Transcript_25841:860-1213(-)